MTEADAREAISTLLAELDKARRERDALVASLPRCFSPDCDSIAMYWYNDDDCISWLHCERCAGEIRNQHDVKEAAWSPIIRSLAGKGGE